MQNSLQKLNTALAFWSSRVRKVREWCPIFIQIEHSARILEPLGNSEGCKVRALCQIPYKIEHSARTLKAQGAQRSHSGGLGRRILDRVNENRGPGEKPIPTDSNGFQRIPTDSNGFQPIRTDSNRFLRKWGPYGGITEGGPVTVFRSHSLVTPSRGVGGF